MDEEKVTIQFQDKSKSKILKNFTEKMIKVIYANVDDLFTFDNNEKAEKIIRFLEKYDFVHIGTGTNRTAFRKNGYVFKIALDRRGIVDNISEYYRAQEAPNYLAKTYETNGLIVVAEYLQLISKEEFLQARSGIRQIIENLSEYYLIGDLGMTEKNYCNWGFRDSEGPDGSKSIVALDYAYMHSLEGYEDAMICEICGGDISPNSAFTGYECEKCHHKYDYVDMYQKLRRLKAQRNPDDIDEIEEAGFVDYYGLE